MGHRTTVLMFWLFALLRIIQNASNKFNFKTNEKLQWLNHSSSLRNVLFDQNSGYQVADDPITRAGFRFEISRVERFEEVAGELKLLSSVFMFWADIRLIWDPRSVYVFQEKAGYNFAISYLQMKMKDIWKPDIKLLNPLNEMNIFKEMGDENAVLDYRGLVYYDGLLKTNTFCEPNLKAFPFDEHECSVQFVATSTMIANIPNTTKVLYDNAKWIYYQMTPCDLDLVPILRVYKAQEINERRVLVFPIKLIRKSSYLFVNIAVPLLVLSILNTVVYFIPAVPEERLSFCIALLLSFTVYLIYVAGLIPETSNPIPLIIYFLIFQFLLSAFITCSSFLTATLGQRQEERPIPNVVTRLLKICRRRKPSIEDDVTDDESLESSDITSRKVTWKSVTLLVDRVFLSVTVVFLLIEVILFVYLASRLSANVELNLTSDICRANPLNLTEICLDDVSGFCISLSILS
ncbi:neuronal acetylcholine receptor subunit alpha-6-like [Ostrea edulis]|uniref:neuronal acetylcholine receptor subunit alpha-6-like n=1 Tax=Ostrea edulis TaxID=37623 RepID=UPI0024AFB9EC|nr:neuronal acetylcholine receptor subunit alpha-6-like [Ostrea edulis]